MSISDRVSELTQGLVGKLLEFTTTNNPQKIIDLLKGLYREYASSDYTSLVDFLRGRNINRIGSVRVSPAQFESFEYLVLDFGTAPPAISSKYEIVSRLIRSGRMEDGHFLLVGHEPHHFYLDDGKKYIGIRAVKPKL